jgi:hypothetical protein
VVPQSIVRAFYIILVPGIVMAMLYLGLGFRPSLKALAGMALFAGLLVALLRRKSGRT